ncbi:hypothetical protein, partial [Desulfovibrio sp.]|uniref:hypothetical protein n=1 Tax=Desulfovibrio sp. TaxID=885 RepID=UPI0039E2A476
MWLPGSGSMLYSRLACISDSTSIGRVLSTVAEHNSAPRLKRHGSVQGRSLSCETRFLLLLRSRLLHWRLQYRCPADVLTFARVRSIGADG